MKAVLVRTGSVSVKQPVLPVSPKVSLTRNNSFTAGENNTGSSPRISLHMDTAGRRHSAPIRRAFSESDVVRSSQLEAPSWKLPARIPEEKEAEEERDRAPFYPKKEGYAGAWPDNGITTEELWFSGGGFDKGKRSGGGIGGDKRKLGDYYKQMLKSNPGNSLLLRNYGKYLHEVEGDTEGAEEYYGRAILANPGDGEVLSLYGKLIWDTRGDSERAQAYFGQAMISSPNDCMVLGSYAHFMWEAEAEEEEERRGIRW
ncbi:hypothetical protein K2173_009410 [Erythroxylum novogranatense]|uniref:TmcB/TmcC TPR repeats domain-containing protein n=1 Tax=Erythroxylum novogranatense TaxID=1862640 RepID=A0AAV8U724_9ROSI|nr:hypothetical protein K2173_009410 [Erythroxylum novogranatense]